MNTMQRWTETVTGAEGTFERVESGIAFLGAAMSRGDDEAVRFALMALVGWSDWQYAEWRPELADAIAMASEYISQI